MSLVAPSHSHNAEMASGHASCRHERTHGRGDRESRDRRRERLEATDVGNRQENRRRNDAGDRSQGHPRDHAERLAESCDRNKKSKTNMDYEHEGRERKKSKHEKDGDRGAATQALRKRTWREEAAKDEEDARDLSTDEDEREQKLLEARRRRQTLMSKLASKEAEGLADKCNVSKTCPQADSDSPGGEVDGSISAPVGRVEEEQTGDMFNDAKEAGDKLMEETRQVVAIGLTGASAEDWDDAEGYYIPKVGELLADRYLVVEPACGKGVYSNVVKAKDQYESGDQQAPLAIKIVRANGHMTKAAEKEVMILERLKEGDEHGRCGVVRLISTFAYRKHFCLVFECMMDDARVTLRKYTKNKGMALQAVRCYARQLLVGLQHMGRCKIIHADIKPENILIGKGHETAKFCDLGAAVEISGCTISPYLGTGCYRPPEIVLGCEWGYPVDTWALGCTLYELFTGKVLMPSVSNNDHLKKMMELKGKIPGKLIKKGSKWKDHFTDSLDFKYEVVGETGPPRTLTDLSAKRSIKDLIMERLGSEKRQSAVPEDQLYVKKAHQFADLLEQMLMLDPEKRMRPADALGHPFCVKSFSVGKSLSSDVKCGSSGQWGGVPPS